MAEFKTKEELAIHILNNIAKNGGWVNDLEYKFNIGWGKSGNDFGQMMCVLDLDDFRSYRIKQPKIPIKYKIGDRFKNEDDFEYILCRVTENQVCLISLDYGNRWVDPVEVVDSRLLTEEEFSLISRGGEFIKI